MYARSTTTRGNPQALDDANAYMRDEVMPAMQEIDGFMGLSMLCERDTGRCIVTTAWSDEQTMRASTDKIRPMRERLLEVLGGEPEVREWEIAVLHRAHPAGDGACARVTWLRTDPGQIDRLLDNYRSVVMPRLQELPGFCSLSMLVDREGGRAVGVASFESREALERTRETARSLREESVRSAGVEMLDVAEMDLVLAHLRVPETV
jgi:hypothetical protein